MKDRLKTIAKWATYPIFYFCCLAMFGYLTFPYDRLKDRLIAEFQHAQAAKAAGKPTQRLEVDKVTSYWFSGIEVRGMRLIVPPDDEPSFPPKSEDTKPAKETVIAVEQAHARVRLLPLLIGRVRIDFAASAFGGEINGTLPKGASNGPVQVEVEGVDLSKVAVLTNTLGLPMHGIASGKLELEASEGKFNKASGSLELTLKDASVGDGVTKIKGQVALPEAKLGDVTLTAEAKDGVLKVTKFGAPGPDVELIGDGKIAVREPWNDSTADLYARFKFSDGYRNKNDLTKSLLGAPGSSAPALFELADPKIKKAKRPDGFYGWHIHGPLKRLKFDPSTSDGAAAGVKPPRAKPGEPGGSPGKKTPGLGFPLGTSQTPDKDDAVVSPPAAPPSPPASPPPASTSEMPSDQPRVVLPQSPPPAATPEKEQPREEPPEPPTPEPDEREDTPR